MFISGKKCEKGKLFNNMKKEISIIIVTYNSDHHIFDCIESIFRYNDIGDALEIIVVDNMSESVDKMFDDLLNKFGNNIVLIRNSQNGGYGQGNNIGIRKSKGKIIMIMNPDVRLIQPIFNEVINHFQDPEVAMLGMVQMVSPVKRGLSFMSKFGKRPLWEVFETFLFNKILFYNYKRMYFSGACFLLRKNDFEDIGLFNERIFLYGEENYLHDRLLTNKPEKFFVFDRKMKYMHLVDSRMPTVNSVMQTLDSLIEFYVQKGINVKIATHNQIKYEIKKALFFKFIRTIKRDEQYVKYYSELLSALRERLIKNSI